MKGRAFLFGVCFVFLSFGNAFSLNVADLDLKLPFSLGEEWLTSCVYNEDPEGLCWTHSSAQKDHLALDFNFGSGSEDCGKPILAVADGRVRDVRYSVNSEGNGYGWLIDIYHGDNYLSRYAHLNQMPSLEIGDFVFRGQEIAKCGSSGTDSCHLHFVLYEVGINGSLTSVEPEPMDGYNDFSLSGALYQSTNAAHMICTDDYITLDNFCRDYDPNPLVERFRDEETGRIKVTFCPIDGVVWYYVALCEIDSYSALLADIYDGMGENYEENALDDSVETQLSIRQITNNSYDDLSPQINSGGEIVWKGWDSSDYEIFFYDGETQQITDDSRVDEGVKINDSGQLVWSGHDGVDYEIYFYDGSLVTQLTQDSISNRSDSDPQINDSGQLTWSKFDGWDKEIYFYDGQNVVKITTNNYHDSYPQINNNGWITWSGYQSGEEIFLYNGTNITRITTNSYNDVDVRINDDGKIVWSASLGPYVTDSELFLYEGSIPATQFTTNQSGDSKPKINNSGQIVWQGGRDSQHLYEIFFYDGISIHQLTNNSYDDLSPEINSSGKIVWEGWDGHDWEIFFHDGTDTIQLTDNDYDDRYPQINDSNQVAWQGFDGNDYEVFLAAITCQ